MKRITESEVFSVLAWLLTAATIIAAAQGDLWLDEIWSVGFALEAESVRDIFLRFRHDNNHPLNTVFLYWLGDGRSCFAYRLLAVLSGIASVGVAGWLAKREGILSPLWAILLVGFNFPLLLYFSEARGYAPAILMGLLGYRLLEPDPQLTSIIKFPLFWAVAALGILSHATFPIMILSFAAWHLASIFHNRRPPPAALIRWLFLHGPPLALFAIWYIVFLSKMTLGGGPVYSVPRVIGQACALILGLPDNDKWYKAAFLIVAAVITAGVWNLYQKRDSRWVFYASAVAFAPAILLFFIIPEYLYFRYFILSFPFFLLLLGQLVSRWYQILPKQARWLAPLVIFILVAGHIPKTHTLLTRGRGHYAEALQYIAECSPFRIVSIGSDHDFRNQIIFAFYAPLIKGGERLRYIEQNRWKMEIPDWIILHSQETQFQPPLSFTLGPYRYSLERRYPYAGISGWSWFLFKRAAD